MGNFRFRVSGIVRLLLDTCSLLWALQSPGRLRAKARKAMEDSENSIHVSPVSFWEISLKCSLGKLELQGATPADIPSFVEKSGWHLVPFQAATASTLHNLPRFPEHKDPFDRMLIWTALRENFTFVSRDGALPLYQELGLQVCG